MKLVFLKSSFFKKKMENGWCSHSLVANESGDFCHIVWNDSGLTQFKVNAAVYGSLPNDETRLKLRLAQKVKEQEVEGGIFFNRGKKKKKKNTHSHRFWRTSSTCHLRPS